MKKILVALDGSPRESGVLDAAIALGRKSGARLILFRSVGIPIELPADAYSMAIEEVPKLLERHATSALQLLEAKIPETLRGGVRVMIGTPWRSIEEAAQKENVDLIVIGAHGHQGLDKLLGTTAAKVVNHADRAVLVVRAAERLLGE
jgi:nucleotide-binding universal stress UspA family protein